jgi:hypothetical protein
MAAAPEATQEHSPGAAVISRVVEEAERFRQRIATHDDNGKAAGAELEIDSGTG